MILQQGGQKSEKEGPLREERLKQTGTVHQLMLSWPLSELENGVWDNNINEPAQGLIPKVLNL